MRSARYHITALPVLGELGSAPPIGLDDLRARVADVPRAREPVDVLLLQDDLMQRESFLAGEVEDVAPSVLTRAEARDEAPLPESLSPGDFEAADEPSGSLGAGRLGVDRLWARYFRHAAEVARRNRCAFLRSWVGFEVGLRNALAAARARRLGLAEADYQVAPPPEPVGGLWFGSEGGGGEGDLSEIVERWASIGDPIAALRVLILASWAWVGRHDAWFTFRNDELAAYAARLLLLYRWHRLARAEERGPR